MRIVVYWEAVVMTLINIYERRRGSNRGESDSALELLKSIDAQTLTDLGMLADAGQELDEVIRFLNIKINE